MMIKHYLELVVHYRRHLIVIVATTTLVAAIFSLVLLHTSPLYTATASVVMLPTEAELTFTRGWLGYSQYNPANVLSQTQMEYLLSRPVAEKTFKKIAKGIAVAPDSVGSRSALSSATGGLRALIWKVYLTLNSGKFVPLEPYEDALQTLRKGIKIEMIEGSYVLQIKVTLPHAGAAAAAANALAEAYDEMMAEQSLVSASKLAGFFGREIAAREAEMDSLSRREYALSQELDMLSLEGQKQYLLTALEGERQALTDAEVKLAELGARMTALRGEQGDVQQGRILARLDEEKSMEGVTRTELDERITVRRRNIESLRLEQEDLAQKEKPLTDVINRKTSVERDLENLRDRRLSVGMASSSQLGQVRMINPARVPLYPSFPKVVYNTVVGFVAGVLLSFFALVVIDTTSGTVKTFADLRRLVGARALARLSSAAIAQATGRGARGRKHLLMELARNLGGHLIGGDSDRPARIEVTGFEEEEAASAAAAVSAALAERGERVVCVLPKSVRLPDSTQDRLLFTNKAEAVDLTGAMLVECLSGISPWRRLTASTSSAALVCVVKAGTLAEEDLEALDKSASAAGGPAPYYVLVAR
jgi:succinoglycan biosynthesis transport protein ExoP